MRPAFSSPKQAAAFALLLLVLLPSPLLMGKKLLPPREELYQFQGYSIAPLPWLHQQIFEETNAIDLAFMGSSRMFHNIDTPYVQKQLSERLGRPAVVRSLCWGGAGYDMLYLVAQDLLVRRQVRMLVFYDEDGQQFRNPLVPCFFRWGDNQAALAGLPLAEKAVFYFVAVEGIPRNILARLRPEIPQPLEGKPNDIETVFHAPNPARRLGSVAAQRGYNADFGVYEPFTSFHPEIGAKPGEVRVYSESTRDTWTFQNNPLPVWQTHFARQFAALAEQHQCRLVLLHIPQIAESPATIPEREFWPDYLSANITMVGIPFQQLTSGMTPEEVRQLYFDPKHFNQNGQEFYTSILTPTLLQLYETHANP